MSLSQKSTPYESVEETACRCREPVSNSERSTATIEGNELARELAMAFGNMVKLYREQYKLSAEDAVNRVAQHPPESINRILNSPLAETTWVDLDALAQKDESLALQRWDQIKRAACDELRSGYRAARTVEEDGGPWERARFAAVRGKLMEDWRPRNATEQLLVEQLAQWQLLLWRWQEALSTWTTHATFAPRKAKKGERYETMRLSESEALERAAAMVERVHALYLRTLKALQDQRRPNPTVTIRHAEQVNVVPIKVGVDNLELNSFNYEALP
jgi:hypothetical protein